jgi:hypothetical protein
LFPKYPVDSVEQFWRYALGGYNPSGNQRQPYCIDLTYDGQQAGGRSGSWELAACALYGRTSRVVGETLNAFRRVISSSPVFPLRMHARAAGCQLSRPLYFPTPEAAGHSLCGGECRYCDCRARARVRCDARLIGRPGTSMRQVSRKSPALIRGKAGARDTREEVGRAARRRGSGCA